MMEDLATEADAPILRRRGVLSGSGQRLSSQTARGQHLKGSH